MAPKKSKLKYLINLAVFIFSIFFLYQKIDFEKVFEITKDVSYYIFIPTIMISVSRTWLNGLRWKTLHPDNEGALTNWSYFRFSMLALLFNRFMPGALGGDIVKTIYSVSDKKTKKSKRIISVVIDRLVGLFSILTFGILALLVSQHKLEFNKMYLYGIFLLFVVALILLFNTKVVLVIERFFGRLKFLQKYTFKIISAWKESVVHYKQNKRKLLYSLLLCIPIHFLSFIIFFIFSKALDIPISFSDLIFVIAIMWLITSLPISIGGMGVRELSLVWLLSMFSVSSEKAVSLSLLFYVNGIIISIIALPLLINIKPKVNDLKT